MYEKNVLLSISEAAFLLHCKAVPIYQSVSTAAQRNALHLKFTLLQCCNEVVDVQRKNQALQLTATQIQWSMNEAYEIPADWL